MFMRTFEMTKSAVRFAINVRSMVMDACNRKQTKPTYIKVSCSSTKTYERRKCIYVDAIESELTRHIVNG